jgi:hypothetical protein
VSANGVQDHLNLLLLGLLLSRRPEVVVRLESSLASQRGRLTNILVDVKRGRPVTSLGDLGNLEDWLDRGQARSLRALKNRLDRTQGSLGDLESRLDRSQTRSPRNLRSRLDGRKARCLGEVKTGWR